MPILTASKFQKKKKNSVINPDCPVCIPTPAAPAFQCFEGHLVCEICLANLEQCLVCNEDYPERKIRARGLATDVCSCCNKKFELIEIEVAPQNEVSQSMKIFNAKSPFRFHKVQGSLIQIMNDRLRFKATGSDSNLGGALSFSFFDRPVQLTEKVSIQVSMGSQRSLFLIAGFSNEDPSTTKNILNLFTSSCYIQIRDTKVNKSVVTFCVDNNGKMEAEADGKILYSDQSFKYNQSVKTSLPMWAYVRVFHKNDQVEILN